MSALMAERRDRARNRARRRCSTRWRHRRSAWSRGQESEAPREEARIVEFPKRPGMPAAPADADAAKSERELEATPEAIEAALTQRPAPEASAVVPAAPRSLAPEAAAGR